MKERRSHFLINKQLQLRYMAFITATLVSVAAAVIISFYFGIWGSVLDVFSDAQVREDLLTASRLTEYENARFLHQDKPSGVLAFFKQAEKLSKRQQEVFKQLLDDTNQKLLLKCFMLFVLIAWGSIYLSHKIAGPLYRFQISLKEIQKGNMTVRIGLRRADEAQFVGDQFNQTAQNLDDTFSRLKKILAENESQPEKIVSVIRQELAQVKTSADR